MHPERDPKRFTFGHALLVGVGYSVVGYAALIVQNMGFLLPNERTVELALVGVMGAALGAAWAPLAMSMVRAKPVAPVLLWMTLMLIPVVAFCVIASAACGIWSWGVVPRLSVAAVIPVLIVPGATYLAARLVRDVPPPGHCTRCHYDLRGNLSGVCPECGMSVERNDLQERDDARASG